jgi:cation diffusion facilitator family transporter
MTRTLKIGWGSLGVSVIVLAMKVAAWLLTGSVALYSDALETTINVAAAATALFALWYGARPPDQNHPYGHYKAENFSALIEGGLVVATAILIANEAWKGWQHPRAPDAPFFGITLNGVAGLINLGLTWTVRRTAERGKASHFNNLVRYGMKFSGFCGATCFCAVA